MSNLESQDDLDRECLMPLAEWVEWVKAGGFIDYDGHGRFATATHVQSDDSLVLPSQVAKGWNPPAWATHICWYNR